jgi:hypothetical protein
MSFTIRILMIWNDGAAATLLHRTLLRRMGRTKGVFRQQSVKNPRNACRVSEWKATSDASGALARGLDGSNPLMAPGARPSNVPLSAEPTLSRIPFP